MAREKKLQRLPSGESFRLRVEPTESGHQVSSVEPRFQAQVERGGDGAWSVLIGERSYEVSVHRDGQDSRDSGEIRVEVQGADFRFGIAGERAGAVSSARAGGPAEVRAPMPGRVVKLLAAMGTPVSAGQGILLFEAMKMQNEIRSPTDGVLAEIAVEEGQAIEARERLFVIRPK